MEREEEKVRTGGDGEKVAESFVLGGERTEAERERRYAPRVEPHGQLTSERRLGARMQICFAANDGFVLVSRAAAALHGDADGTASGADCQDAARGRGRNGGVRER